jgi:hypothetical protein
MNRFQRTDALTRQHLDVALVFQEIIGTDEAISYLNKHGIPSDAVQRVILSPDYRRSSQTASNDPLSHSSERVGKVYW